MSSDYRPVPAPEIPDDAHKGTAGRVLCLCGGALYPGAAILVVRAAQRAGAGLVTLGFFDPKQPPLVASAVPETVYLDLTRSKDLFAGRLPREIREHKHDVRVAGPGLTTSGHTRELVRRLIASDFNGPTVLDADALNVIGATLEAMTEYRGMLVLTPHPGEASRLLDREVPRSPEGRLECALEIQKRSGAICVLKGAGTIVTDGTRTFVNDTGCPSMATAGSGDVLVGIMGAYLAAAALGTDAEWTLFDAVAAAVHVHGLAGERAAAARGQRGTIASDLIEFLPAAQLAFAEAGGRP